MSATLKRLQSQRCVKLQVLYPERSTGVPVTSDVYQQKIQGYFSCCRHIHYNTALFFGFGSAILSLLSLCPFFLLKKSLQVTFFD